ncbi:hypothetical protein SAMN02745196_01138 [Clostridium collagenovorans DSM 3089]|uniref:Uncharacterized protein n=1 Tax=Clostridium collagenovorans DSM 3089 TaxID=1121306 RepID=A0A1M5V6P9_9CLOT|nr:hypothetical protein [Clostridium collagenovorans]SHH70905.1 hypothetical protein SAMN02745196_01138 [Clostridium collagenovorans DSM 3089]
MKNTSNITEIKKTLKRKWLKDNTLALCIITLIILVIYVVTKILNSIFLVAFNTILAFSVYLYMRNKMMSFIEKEMYIKNKEP